MTGKKEIEKFHHILQAVVPVNCATIKSFEFSVRKFRELCIQKFTINFISTSQTVRWLKKDNIKLGCDLTEIF